MNLTNDDRVGCIGVVRGEVTPDTPLDRLQYWYQQKAGKSSRVVVAAKEAVRRKSLVALERAGITTVGQMTDDRIGKRAPNMGEKQTSRLRGLAMMVQAGANGKGPFQYISLKAVEDVGRLPAGAMSTSLIPDWKVIKAIDAELAEEREAAADALEIDGADAQVEREEAQRNEQIAALRSLPDEVFRVVAYERGYMQPNAWTTAAEATGIDAKGYGAMYGDLKEADRLAAEGQRLAVLIVPVT